MRARRTQQGFTLIELLIVIVIIGILATIAVPRFTNSKTVAQIAVLRADLRNLVTAQENRLAAQGSYAGTVDDLSMYFTPSNDVTIEIVQGGNGAYAARAFITSKPSVWCEVGEVYRLNLTPTCSTDEGVEQELELQPS
jgi:prepilin-type N-terminal cleavage/methylation domain-containing protein